jgi:hypothetical protein
VSRRIVFAALLVLGGCGAEPRTDWTRHPAIRRDAEGGGRHNQLAVQMGADEAVFLVNGSEVARVPASELALRGRAGLRAAHDVQIEVNGFRTGRGGP